MRRREQPRARTLKSSSDKKPATAPGGRLLSSSRRLLCGFVLLLTRGLHLSKGQLIDVEGRLQTRQWDDDAGVRHWKTEVVVNSLEMLSGRGKKEYAKEAQTIAEAGPDGLPAEQAAANGEGEVTEEALVAM